MNGIFFDYNNLAMRCLFAREVGADSPAPNWDMWGYLVFESILGCVARFQGHSPERVIVAVDDCQSWRKVIYPRYKEQRAAKKESMGVNWDDFYGHFHALLDDFAAHTPFIPVKARLCEADDVIAVLAMKLPGTHVVVSADEDYTQLLSQSNISVWNPLKHEWVREIEPNGWLVRKCLMGQAKDNIFNVLTPDDWGLTDETRGKRKPGFGEKAADKVMRHPAGVVSWLAENGHTERFRRNQRLISFNRIPVNIHEEVGKEWLAAHGQPLRVEMAKLNELFERRGWFSCMRKEDDIKQILRSVWR